MTTGVDETAAPPEVERPTGAPDVRKATDKVRDKRTGEVRPRKSNAGRKPKAARSAPEPDSEAPAVSPEDEAKAGAVLAATAWGIAGPMFGCRALTDEEALRLGGALAPVLKKYLPALGEWQLEINLAVVLYVTFQSTKIPRPPQAYDLQGEVIDLPTAEPDAG